MVVRELVNIIGWKVDENQLRKAEKKSVKFLNSLKKIGLLAGAGIIAIGTAAITAAANMESLTAQFEVMLGSTEKATALMEELKTFAAITPFSLNELAKGTQNLLAFGVEEKDVIDRLKMLGDTAGGSSEKLQGLILAYGKVQTKGKASMEEINMLAERGIPIIGVLQEQLGVTEKEFFKLVSAGKISRDEITQAFKTMTSEGGIFFKGMEVASKTFAGLVSTMKDNITLLLAEIGTKLLPTMKKLVIGVTNLFQNTLGKMIDRILSIITPLLDNIFTLLDAALKAILPIVDALINIIQPILSIITTLLPIITDIFSIFGELLGEIINDFAQALVPLLETVGVLLKELMPLIRPVLKIMTMFAALMIKLRVLSNLFLFKILAKGLILILKLLSPVTKILEKVLIPVFDTLEKILDNISNFVTRLQERLPTLLFNIFVKGLSKVVALFKNIINFVVNLQANLRILFFEIFQKGLKAILEFLDPVIQVLKTVLIPIFEKLEGLLIRITDFVKGVINEIVEGITTGIGFLIKSINKIISVVNKIPFVKEKLDPISEEEIVRKIKSDIVKTENKITSLQMKNDFTFYGKDINKKEIKETVKQVTGTPFQLEIKKIIAAAG